MNNQDKKIAQLLQRDLPMAGADPWFTRKVMNRLPRRRNSTSPFELVCIIMSCVALIAAFIIESSHILSSQQLLVRDMVTMATLIMMTLGLGWWIVKPYLRS